MFSLEPPSFNRLPRDFYTRPTEVVAKDLLGKYLVHQTTPQDIKIGKIVEVEAYLGERDLACHASKGRTPRTSIMFGPPGYAYVYLIYGMYYCFNVVTEPEDCGCAVLIRAIEPLYGIEARTNGPGLLCQAMGINKQLNGVDLVHSDFYLAEASSLSPFRVVKSRRIGVPYAKHWAKRLLRFYIKGNAFVSKI